MLDHTSKQEANFAFFAWSCSDNVQKADAPYVKRRVSKAVSFIRTIRTEWLSP